MLDHSITPLAAGGFVSPVAVLVLCVIAGIGTLLLLPGRRELSIRRVGAAILIATGLILVALVVRSSQAPTTAGGVYFWIFAAIAVASAVRVITHTKPVYSALYFVLTILASAGLFILLWAEFMAAALVLIYAGAILVTYVFVIMLASQAELGGAGADAQGVECDLVSREPLLATTGGFALMGLILFLIFEKAEGLPASGLSKLPGSHEFGISELGGWLFANQLVGLELSGLLLTVAMVGAIVIARRKVVPEVSADAVAPKPDPIDDNPHSIPVFGTNNPTAKAFPET